MKDSLQIAMLPQLKMRILHKMALFILLAWSPCIAKAEAIRVGIPGLSAEFTPVWAAHDRGRLKRYGLDTEIIVMQGGTQLIPAMVAGSIDFAVMGGARSEEHT